MTLARSEHPRRSVAVARTIAAIIPALLVAFPMLILPLLDGSRQRTDLARYLDPTTSGNSVLLSAVYYPAILALATVLFLVARPRISRQFGILTFWLVTFIGLALVSTAWSLAPSRTFMKAVQQAIICGALILSVAAAGDSKPIFRAIFWTVVLVVAANLLAVASRPPGPIGHEGIYAHKNGLGAYAAMSTFFGLFALSHGRLITRLAGLFTLAGAVFLLFASESKTSIGLALLAPSLAILMYGLARRAHVSPLASLTVGLAICIAGYLLFGEYFGFRAADALLLLFNDETFTGRTHIWAFSWSHIVEHPVLGHGYQGFWNTGPESPRFTANVAFIANMLHGHNGYLDTLLELGIAGLCVLLIILGYVFLSVDRLFIHGSAMVILALTNLMHSFIRNFMESDWFGIPSASFILFLITGLCAGLAPKYSSFAAQKPHVLGLGTAPVQQ